MAESLFSEIFFEVTTKKVLEGMFQQVHDRLGNYRSKPLLDWKSRRVEGANAIRECQLIYEVIYEKYKAEETIGLVEGEHGFRIVLYHVNSEGLKE